MFEYLIVYSTQELSLSPACGKHRAQKALAPFGYGCRTNLNGMAVEMESSSLTLADIDITKWSIIYM